MAEERRARAEVVRGLAESLRDERGALMPVLHAVMSEYGHLAREDVIVVADVLNLSIADVHGVVSFYEDFRTAPPAPHTVRVCRGEACQAVGADDLFATDVVQAVTGDGEADHQQVFCLGNCALGPSVMVDGRLFGRVTPERLRALSAGLRS